MAISDWSVGGALVLKKTLLLRHHGLRITIYLGDLS